MSVDLTANTVAQYKMNDDANTANVDATVGIDAAINGANSDNLQLAGGGASGGTRPYLSNMNGAFRIWANAYIELDAAYAFNASNNLSYSFWVYMDSPISSEYFLVSNADTAGGNWFGFEISFLDSTSKFKVHGWNGTLGYASGTTFVASETTTLDGWHHVVFNYNGTTGDFELYVDTENIIDNTDTWGSTVEIALLGRNSTSATSDIYLLGAMDNFCIFDKTLSQDEIDFLYNSGAGTEGLTFEEQIIDPGEEQRIVYPESYEFKYDSNLNNELAWIILNQEGVDKSFAITIRNGNLIFDVDGSNEYLFDGTIGETIFIENIINPFYVTYQGPGSVLFDIDFYSWEQPYIDIAVAFDATLSDVPDEIKHLKEALFVIIDLKSTGIGSTAAARLLTKLDLLYRQARKHYNYNTNRSRMVRLINDFTIEFFGDLTTFVNALNWHDGCVPFYWAQLSEDSGYDTSKWIVCS